MQYLILLHPLEPNEVADLALSFGGERLEIADELPRFGAVGSVRFSEELTHFEVEDLEDLEQGVEPHLVLALLHPRQVGLRNADLLGKLRLGEAPPLAQLPDAGAD